MSVNRYISVTPAEFAPWLMLSPTSLGTPPLLPTATPIASAETPVPTSTPVGTSDRPLAAGELMVGGRARVYTTEGDVLNMRSGPGTSYSIVWRLTLDTRVDVLEGPIEAEGYTWWRIDAGDGFDGWAVDFVDDIPTLIPE